MMLLVIFGRAGQVCDCDAGLGETVYRGDDSVQGMKATCGDLLCLLMVFV
jgi:hypothetical protein